MNNTLVYINSMPSLIDLCRQLQGCAWLAVDTEFERTNTYYPQLCLVQISVPGTVAVVDPLAIPDPAPLYALLYAPAITKVFHAARQDLELFFHLKGELPVPIFDTQVAATLLGYERQIGYANLVREVLGVDLPKTQTNTDWRRRPLSRRQLEYAADDVIYLGRMYEVLLDKLIESGLLPQFEEQCLALNRPELYAPDPGEMWRKIKLREVEEFSDRSLQVFKELAAWREVTARKENLPRKWIIKDTTLAAIARELPSDRNALSRLDGMDEKTLRRYGEALLQIAAG